MYQHGYNLRLYNEWKIQVADVNMYAHFKPQNNPIICLWNHMFIRKSRKAWIGIENNFKREKEEGIG